MTYIHSMTHSHKYGDDVYLFSSDQKEHRAEVNQEQLEDTGLNPFATKLCALFKVTDFQPARDEFLNFQFDLKVIPLI